MDTLRRCTYGGRAGLWLLPGPYGGPRSLTTHRLILNYSPLKKTSLWNASVSSTSWSDSSHGKHPTTLELSQRPGLRSCVRAEATCPRCWIRSEAAVRSHLRRCASVSRPTRGTSTLWQSSFNGPCLKFPVDLQANRRWHPRRDTAKECGKVRAA